MILLTNWGALFASLLGPIVLLGVLLLLSAVVSSAEVAFFSLTKGEISDFKNDNSPSSIRVWKLVSQPKKLLATILITNNFVNVGAILVASSILYEVAEALAFSDALKSVLEIFLITAILLFVGEIVPKIYAAQNRVQLVKSLSGIMQQFVRILSPFSALLINTTQFIDNRIPQKTEMASIQDLKDAIELTSADNEEQDDWLKGVVNFGKISVKNIMRARVDVAAIDVTLSFEQLLEIINELGYSRMPVYEDSLDKIKGILHIKDLLPMLNDSNSQANWNAVIRDAYFVPEFKKIDDLLDEFKANRMHMAIVVDEYGGTSGIITLEDIIEEIFGEINDEFDSDALIVTKISNTEFLFPGRIPLNDLRRFADLDEEEFEDARGDSDSLGGLILELKGKIPRVGEEIVYKHYTFFIESILKNRIDRVKMVVGQAIEEEE